MEAPSCITDKELNTYLSDIKQQLSLTYSQKQVASILQMLTASIDDFISEHPDATICDLKEHFGDINDLKEMFLSSAESTEIENRLDSSKQTKNYIKIFLIFVALILLIYIGFRIKLIIDLEKSIPAYEIIRIE